METSIIISRAISVIYLASGFAVLAGTLNFYDLIRNLDDSPALSFVSGAAGSAIGIILVSIHNIWPSDWRLLITLISWCFLLGGITVIVFPKILNKMNFPFLRLRIFGLPMIFVGLLFGYFGFIGAP